MFRFVLGMALGVAAMLLVGSAQSGRIDRPVALDAEKETQKYAFPITRDYVITIDRAGEFLPDYIDQKLLEIKAELSQWQKLYGIEIVGHTDAEGTELENLLLSLRRAGAVGERLAEMGFEDGLISFDGFGEIMPVADNSTEAGRSQNRRLEIRAYGLVDQRQLDVSAAALNGNSGREADHAWF